MSLFFKDKKNISFKVGLFSIVVIIIFIISYSYLNDLLQSYKYTDIMISFPNINNLEIGNTVTINGFKRGRVKSISISEDGVLVHTLVDLDFELKEGTLFIIKESDLMGNHQIDIIPGKSQVSLDLTQVQAGLSREGLTDLIARMNSMAVNVERIFVKLENADNLLDNLNLFLENANHTFTMVDQVFVNPKSNNDIKTLITQLNSSTRELTSILIDNKENIRKTLQSSAVSFDKLNYTLSTADSAIVLLNTIAQKINTNDNNIGGLLNDKKLYNNLLQSSERVDSLLIDIKKSPRKYFRISIF